MPSETSAIIRVYSKKETELEKEAWNRAAYTACWIVNQSGFSGRKTPLRPHHLITFTDQTSVVDKEQREKEALEALRKQKEKNWMLIEGGSLEEVGFLQDDSEKAKYLMKKYGIPEGDMSPDEIIIRQFIEGGGKSRRVPKK